jgi:acyl-CoA thioesterase-2
VCHALRLIPHGANSFEGRAVPVSWGHPYGGVLLAQAYAAAAATVPAGRSVRSMHAYFIEVGRDDVNVDLDVTVVRDGRNSCWRSVELVQDERLLLTAELVFSVDRDGLGHQDPMPAAPDPGELTNVGTDLEPHRGDTFIPWDADSAFDLRYVSTPLRLAAAAGDPPGEARSRVWMKAAGSIDADPTLATALLVYASDLCTVDPCLVPHDLWFGPGGATGLSIDHSIWFHAPARVDDWILMDQRSPAMTGGRGLALADMYAADGELLCSVAQLGSLRVSG